jgi:hypothetical protein
MRFIITVLYRTLETLFATLCWVHSMYYEYLGKWCMVLLRAKKVEHQISVSLKKLFIKKR